MSPQAPINKFMISIEIYSLDFRPKKFSFFSRYKQQHYLFCLISIKVFVLQNVLLPKIIPLVSGNKLYFLCIYRIYFLIGTVLVRILPELTAASSTHTADLSEIVISSQTQLFLSTYLFFEPLTKSQSYSSFKHEPSRLNTFFEIFF